MVKGHVMQDKSDFRVCGGKLVDLGTNKILEFDKIIEKIQRDKIQASHTGESLTHSHTTRLRKDLTANHHAKKLGFPEVFNHSSIIKKVQTIIIYSVQNVHTTCNKEIKLIIQNLNQSFHRFCERKVNMP